MELNELLEMNDTEFDKVIAEVTTRELTPTEFLFGHKKEHYYGIEFPELAHVRIADARALGNKLNKQLNYDPKYQDENQMQLHYRLGQVQDAIYVWSRILELDGK